MWIVQPREVQLDGKPLGMWKLAVESEGGEIFSDDSHPPHATAEDARACSDCRAFCDSYVGTDPVLEVPSDLANSYRKKPVVIEAHRWFKNGDHPADGDKNTEGHIVRYYRNPQINGELECSKCTCPMHDHGWIDTLEGGHNVCIGDWIIKGVKGEFYPCKPDIFAATYEKCVGGAHDFGWAIAQLKAGEKVRRSGWNGKGMFIVYMGELNLPPYNTQGTERKVNDRTAKWIGEDTPLESQGYFAMFTAQKKWQPGWLASQADMLSNDWELA